MFGLVTPCRHSLPDRLRRAWMAHLCGVCLTLRDGYGHSARLVTNVDAVMISVLVAAQRADLAPVRVAGACPLRGMRRASVVRSDSAAAGFAAGVSLALAAEKLTDHCVDGDLRGPLRPAARWVGRRWERLGRAELAGAGLDPSALVGVADRQAGIERGHLRRPGAQASSGSDLPALLAVTAPTEAAVGAAMAHTARLAGCPANGPALADAGRHIGRIAHLTDAVVDRPDDDRRGRWNPLTATGTADATAIGLIEDALLRTRDAVTRLDLPGRHAEASADTALQADLARRLLGDALPRSVRRILARAGHATGICHAHEDPGGAWPHRPATVPAVHATLPVAGSGVPPERGFPVAAGFPSGQRPEDPAGPVDPLTGSRRRDRARHRSPRTNDCCQACCQDCRRGCRDGCRDGFLDGCSDGCCSDGCCCDC